MCFLFHPVKSLGRVGRLSFFFNFFYNLILTTNIQHIKVAHNLEHVPGLVAMLYNLSTHTLEYLKYFNLLSAFPLTKQILTQWFRAEPVNF